MDDKRTFGEKIEDFATRGASAKKREYDASEEGKADRRAEFDAFHNENIKGERISNKPYPASMQSSGRHWEHR
jgi:hypothetical protein